MSIDKQAREELRKRYTPPEIPNCSICGASLSIQRCGGGEPTVYACDGYEADPENPGMARRAAGRGIADKHYEESRYIDWIKGGDLDVIALLDELEAAEKRIAELTAPDGNAIAWESTTPVYIKFITDERYRRLRPGYQKWYKPYRCSNCAAGISVKGE